MIGDRSTIEGAVFTIRHWKCAGGLVHALLSVDGARLSAPAHDDNARLGGELTQDPVLSCLVCIAHVFKNTPTRRSEASDMDDE